MLDPIGTKLFIYALVLIELLHSPAYVYLQMYMEEKAINPVLLKTIIL